MDIASSREFIANQYHEGEGYKLRWVLYDFADDGLPSFHQQSIEKLDLTGQESVLDIGCGQGEFLSSIRSLGHTGLLAGMDYVESLPSAQEGVSYVRGDASIGATENNRYIPFADESFDIVSAMFMLYHVSEPRKTLLEMARICKTGGKIVVATSSEDNKPWHRYFEKEVSTAVNSDTPPILNERFTSEIASEVLPTLFKDVEVTIDQDTTVTITKEHIDSTSDTGEIRVNTIYSEDATQALAVARIREIVEKLMKQEEPNPYLAFISSITKTLYELRTPGSDTRKIEEAVSRIVRQEILKIITREGVFQERIRRTLFVCSDPREVCDEQ